MFILFYRSKLSGVLTRGTVTTTARKTVKGFNISLLIKAILDNLLFLKQHVILCITNHYNNFFARLLH